MTQRCVDSSYLILSYLAVNNNDVDLTLPYLTS